MAAITTAIAPRTAPGAPLATDRRRKHSITSAVSWVGAAATTRYHYRTTLGARGSTTSVGAIPVGAVVERRTTGP